MTRKALPAENLPKVYPQSKSDFETLKRSSIVCLMYLFFEDGHLHPACISNKLQGMRLQAGFDATPDLMLCVPYFEMSSTKGWMYFLNSSLRVEIDTPLLAWKYSPDLDLTIRRTSGYGELDCDKPLTIRSVTETRHEDFPDLARKEA